MIYCKDCQYLQDYATGMSEVWSQWACESPSLKVNHRSWLNKWSTYKYFGFWNKPRWRNRGLNCKDYKVKEQK